MDGHRSDRHSAWAQRLQRSGLAPIAVIALEALKPAGVICGQMLEAASIVGGSRLSALGQLWEDPDSIAALQTMLMGETSTPEEGQRDA